MRAMRAVDEHMQAFEEQLRAMKKHASHKKKKKKILPLREYNTIPLQQSVVSSTAQMFVLKKTSEYMNHDK